MTASRHTESVEPKPGHRSHPHRKQAVVEVATYVITVSDTRTLETDTGGALVADFLEGAGHPIAGRSIVPDEPDRIALALQTALADKKVERIMSISA